VQRKRTRSGRVAGAAVIVAGGAAGVLDRPVDVALAAARRGAGAAADVQRQRAVVDHLVVVRLAAPAGVEVGGVTVRVEDE